jgi:DNA transposition AAA+ family ATPase
MSHPHELKALEGLPLDQIDQLGRWLDEGMTIRDVAAKASETFGRDITKATVQRYIILRKGGTIEGDGAPKAYSQLLRTRLQEYITTHNITQTELARQLGVSPTAVSKYLSGDPVGDVAKFEALATDVLKAADNRKQASTELFETSISKSVGGAIETIRKTNDVGLISGNAGIGKSKSLEIYLLQNPTAVLVDLKTWGRTGKQIETCLWEQIEPRKWKGGSKSKYLVDHFRDSNRPLIFDNAHRLRKPGLEWIFDFYDSTNIPICLVGNPEVLDIIRRNDQHFSRIGLHKQLKSIKAAHEIAEKLINQIAPQFLSCLELAIKVVESRGHVRALRKQLNLAHELTTQPSFRAKGSAADLPMRAFRAAHDKLIRDYAL